MTTQKHTPTLTPCCSLHDFPLSKLIKAANSHDALVEALEACTYWIGTVCTAMNIKLEDDHPLLKAEAALRLAKGEDA